jgi:hypothetical protein
VSNKPLTIVKQTSQSKNQNDMYCNLCNKIITKRQSFTKCFNNKPHLVHRKCANTTSQNYKRTPFWICSQHASIKSKPKHNRQTTNNQFKLSTNTTTEDKNLLKIVQININGISNKSHELNDFVKTHDVDILLVQETKLNPDSKTPLIQNFSAIRKDRTSNKGGGLITYVKTNITFSDIKVPLQLNDNFIEVQNIKIHLDNTKFINLVNLYIAPRDFKNKDKSY